MKYVNFDKKALTFRYQIDTIQSHIRETKNSKSIFDNGNSPDDPRMIKLKRAGSQEYGNALNTWSLYI